LNFLPQFTHIKQKLRLQSVGRGKKRTSSESALYNDKHVLDYNLNLTPAILEAAFLSSIVAGFGT